MATTGVSLMWLLDGIATVRQNDARVEDLTLDSRMVRPGSLFFALRGLRAHGLDFVAEAVARGASAVLWDPAEARGVHSPGVDIDVGAAFGAPVAGLGALLGRIADRFFGWPSSQMRITGITGTNGKTTCAYLLAECLQRLHADAAYIGTLGWGRPGALEAPTHTTPDVVNLHRQLSKLRAQGVRDVALEVSSHALDQGRIDGVQLHAAAFTNLTRDHLDYHVSMEAYGAAKARLFAVPDLKHVVVNIADDFGRELARGYSGRAPLTAVWVGAGASGWLADSSLHADEVVLDLTGICLAVSGSFGTQTVKTRLLGRFNAENAVVVLGCLTALGVSLAEAAAALAGCSAPPGRMEVIEAAGPPGLKAVIDYAHTPDALAKALIALKEHCRGTLWCVFGCGGDRDAGKRPLMGAIADEWADEIIVTDDNPRSEDPETITNGILLGFKTRRARVIHDRGQAIATALGEAAAGDLVLIAGKGHEDYQIYGDVRRSFSDRDAALRSLGVAA